MNQITKLPIESHQGELRADSRKIAAALGVQHETVIRLLNEYRSEFETLGDLRFEIGTSKPQSNNNSVQKTKFTFLNEDHAYLLLTMTRNNSSNLPLKIRLISTFKEARQKIRLFSEQGVSALKSITPQNTYGEPSANGLPKVSIRNACFYAAKTPKAEKLKQAYEVYRIAEQLSFFWLLEK